MRNQIKIFAMAVCITLGAGCASVPMTTASLDSEAKDFQPQSGKASIYVNRKGGFAGGAVIIQLASDGRIPGSVAPGTFLLLSVPPGQHVLMTSGQFENVAQAKLEVEQGKNYFFDVGLSMGWTFPHVNLRQVSEDEGQKAVNASKRAEAFTY